MDEPYAYRPAAEEHVPDRLSAARAKFRDGEEDPAAELIHNIAVATEVYEIRTELEN